MGWAEDSDPVERLHRTATSTRDMVVHTDATRWEVFAKASTLRQSVFEPDPPLEVSVIHETGVAVRMTGHGRSGFGAASGLEALAARVAVEGAASSMTPLPFDPLPPVRLLGCTPVGPPRNLPGAAWASQIAEALTTGIREASGSRLVIRRLVFQEASYAWLLATGDGFVATRHDATLSFLVHLGPRDGQRSAHHEWIWVQHPEFLDPLALAAAMCDRAALTDAALLEREGLYDLLLHPEVCAHFLSALSPLFLPTEEEDDPLTRLLDRDGRFASDVLSLIDDRSAPDCPPVAPCDGEGLPTRRRILLDRGVPRHRLACHFEAQLYGEPTHGGARRLSYRDYPTTGIGALRVEPDPGLNPVELLRGSGKSLYLLRLLSAVDIDPAADTFRMLAQGVWLDGGSIEGFQPVVEITGALSLFLRRIEAVGTDLGWFQTPAGFIEAPTLRVSHQRVGG